MKDVLIVEDGESERERLRELFAEAGYQTIACETVAHAERCLQFERFRLAILDIGLGDRSGSYLFEAMRREGKVDFVIIFTGNPSVHLKQRFIAEGASDYIVKASARAQNQPFLERVREILGAPLGARREGLSLSEFLERFVAPESRDLFYDMDGTVPSCRGCGEREYVVQFNHRPQVPPELLGMVVCSRCGTALDPEVL